MEMLNNELELQYLLHLNCHNKKITKTQIL